MTVYQLIQELAKYDADALVDVTTAYDQVFNINVESNGAYEVSIVLR